MANEIFIDTSGFYALTKDEHFEHAGYIVLLK